MGQLKKQKVNKNRQVMFRMSQSSQKFLGMSKPLKGLFLTAIVFYRVVIFDREVHSRTETPIWRITYKFRKYGQIIFLDQDILFSKHYFGKGYKNKLLCLYVEFGG